MNLRKKWRREEAYLSYLVKLTLVTTNWWICRRNEEERKLTLVTECLRALHTKSCGGRVPELVVAASVHLGLPAHTLLSGWVRYPSPQELAAPLTGPGADTWPRLGQPDFLSWELRDTGAVSDRCGEQSCKGRCGQRSRPSLQETKPTDGKSTRANSHREPRQIAGRETSRQLRCCAEGKSSQIPSCHAAGHRFLEVGRGSSGSSLVNLSGPVILV